MGRGGFRIDRQMSCCDTLTMQGDYYNGDAGLFQTLPTPGAPFVQTGPQQRSMVGGNALLRWTHQIDDESDWSLQAYYDRTERTFHAADFREYRDTVDVDFQHRFHWNDRNSIIWGFGYRNSRDQIRNTPFHLQFLPPDRSDDRFSTFVQDEVTLCDD